MLQSFSLFGIGLSQFFAQLFFAAGQKYFLSALEVGFETELDKTVDTSTTGAKAKAKQTIQSWQQARNYKTAAFTIGIDNEYKLSGELFSLSVSNLKFTSPEAKDTLVIEICDHPGKQVHVNRYLLGVMRDRHTTTADREVTSRVFAQHMVLKTEPSSTIMVDGKVAGRTPIAIRLTDKKIRIITEKSPSEFKSAVQNTKA